MKQLITAFVILLGGIVLPLRIYACPFSETLSATSESDKPIASPYYLQHQYLSVLAPEIELRDSAWLADPFLLNTVVAESTGFRSPFETDEIEVTVIYDEGVRVYIWRFPEPQYCREALYLMFVPDEGHYTAYAISIGQHVDWEISKSTQSYRSTYGRVKRPDNANECYSLLKDRGALTGKISPGEFVQEGYVAPPGNYDFKH